MSGRALVLGVGQRQRGDDAVGLLAVEALREQAPAGVTVRPLEGTPVELCCHWEPDDAVILIDAARGAGPAGAIRRLDALAAPLPKGLLAASTHVLGVAQGVELARALGRLPRRLTVYAVEGERFGLGSTPTPAVLDAIPGLVREVLAELEAEA